MGYAKIKIEGTIKLITGLHIGGDGSFSAIGAIDSPVVRDPLSRNPYIPGSSLKGKLRYLLSRELVEAPTIGSKVSVNDHPIVKRLFGCSNSNESEGGAIQRSRLQFSDCFLKNKEELPQLTETKFENSIDRLTAVANPRQIERVIRGAEFDLLIIYNVDNPAELDEDFESIGKAFKLLEYDYLGGGGTRGNGRVSINDISVEYVTGEGIEPQELDKAIKKGKRNGQ